VQYISREREREREWPHSQEFYYSWIILVVIINLSPYLSKLYHKYYAQREIGTVYTGFGTVCGFMHLPGILELTPLEREGQRI
jgi:hypothetical protein